MFLLIFFGGFSIWVYIILWIIIPEAKTTADKFAMRGEAANINNIFKSFKDEAEDVKNRFKNNNYGTNVRSNISTVLNSIFNIIGRLIGLFLIMIGCAFLFAYVTSLFGISVADSNSDITNWKAVIFSSSTDYALAVFSFIIVAGIPVFMLLYAGIKLLFKIKYTNRWLNLSLGLTWVLGLIIGFYVTVSTVKQFNEVSKVKEIAEVHGVGDTLIIKLNPAMNTLKPFGFDNADDLDTYFGRNNSGYQFGDLNKKLAIIGCAGLDVIESTSDSIELVINYEARGNTKKEANENAKSIKYAYSQNNNELIFDEVFTVLAGTKFRAQEVDIKIKLPKGKVIYFDKSVKYLLDDIENTTNTWDGNMVGRRWKMTDRGLECIDCKGLEELDEDYDEHHHNHNIKTKNITINEDGIKVNGTDAEIKIDEHGIKIKTPKEPKEPEDVEEIKKVDIKGPKGEKGIKGEKGDKGEK